MTSWRDRLTTLREKCPGTDGSESSVSPAPADLSELTELSEPRHPTAGAPAEALRPPVDRPAPPPEPVGWLVSIARSIRAALADGAMRVGDEADGWLLLVRPDGRRTTVAPHIVAELEAAGLLPPLPDPGDEAAADDPIDAAERAAVAVEPEPPPKGTPEFARWYSEHTLRALENARTVRSLLEASRQRPPYWPDDGSPPPQGAWCTTCRGSGWWRPARPATDGTGTGPGWRCAACHPPDHLPKDQIKELRT